MEKNWIEELIGIKQEAKRRAIAELSKEYSLDVRKMIEERGIKI